MPDISIPASLGEAVTALQGLGKLICAREWERAAIVYAFTRDGEAGEVGRGRRSESTTSNLTPREFAALGITGLRSDQTVRRYRKAWQGAVDAGKAMLVVPGQTVETPSADWGEFYVSERDTRGPTVELPTVKDRVKLAEHFRENPESAERVAEALPPRALQAAIKADPATAEAAKEALQERRNEEYRSAWAAGDRLSWLRT